ncbi:MAG: GNAT family N-acetyltransferase [Nakamurella multipartita]
MLPLATGGSSAHVLAVDYALRPVLSALGAAHVTPGWFVPSAHIRVFPDGGVLLDAASLAPIAQVTDEFLATLATARAGSLPLRVDAAAGPRVRPVAGADDLAVHRVDPSDPRLRPLLTDLVVEYGTRYGRESANTELTEVAASDFAEPDGTFLLLVENGETVAGGALRRYDHDTAEVKRVWTAHGHRRRGLARRVMAELEAAAHQLGYRRIHLTTGPANRRLMSCTWRPAPTVRPHRRPGVDRSAAVRQGTGAGAGLALARPARSGPAATPEGPAAHPSARLRAGARGPATGAFAGRERHSGMTAPAGRASVVFVGGGPRTVGLVERIAANAPALFRGRMDLHVIDPFPAGGGRIWRGDQSELLWMNSMARDVTVFTDDSVTCAGPIVPGPALHEWIAGPGRAVLDAAGRR